MSGKNQNQKAGGGPRGLRTTENQIPHKVKMKFKEHKYYTDKDKPIFYAGKIYELEGADWIQRWLKRGGEIVQDARPAPAPTPSNPSVVVPKSGAPAGDNKPENKETTPVQGKAPEAPKPGEATKLESK